MQNTIITTIGPIVTHIQHKIQCQVAKRTYTPYAGRSLSGAAQGKHLPPPIHSVGSLQHAAVADPGPCSSAVWLRFETCSHCSQALGTKPLATSSSQPGTLRETVKSQSVQLQGGLLLRPARRAAGAVGQE